MHAAWEVSKGGPSERHWIRSWSIAAALMKYPIISNCLSSQTSLSTKGSQPSCMLPASWSRTYFPLCRGLVGVVRTWAAWPQGWTSSPLPPTSWRQPSSQNQPTLSGGQLLKVWLPWQLILYPLRGRGTLVCDLIWWVGSTISISPDESISSLETPFAVSTFPSRNPILQSKQSLGGMWILSSNGAWYQPQRRNCQTSSTKRGWQQQCYLLYNCTKVLLWGTCWGWRGE